MEVSRKMANLLGGGIDRDLNLKETELCLGLPGGGGSEVAETPRANGKRGFSETVDLKLNLQTKESAPSDLKEMPVKNGPKEKNLLPGADSTKDPAKPPAKWVRISFLTCPVLISLKVLHKSSLLFSDFTCFFLLVRTLWIWICTVSVIYYDL